MISRKAGKPGGKKGGGSHDEVIFSFCFDRLLEIFSRPVIFGSVLVVAGTILLI